MKFEYRLINPNNVDISDPSVAYDTEVFSTEAQGKDHLVITLKVLPVENSSDSERTGL
jgi:hypothetical protein